MKFEEKLIQEMNTCPTGGHLQLTYCDDEQRIYIDTLGTENEFKTYYAGVSENFDASMYRDYGGAEGEDMSEDDETVFIDDVSSWLNEVVVTAGHIYDGWNDEGRVVSIGEYANNVFDVQYSDTELDNFKACIADFDKQYKVKPPQAVIDSFMSDFDPFPNCDNIDCADVYGYVWKLVR